MNFSDLIKARKSIRGFQNKAVPQALIDDIIEVAKWAPSSMNTQPWHVHVVTGEPLDRIRQGNMNNMVKGIPAKRDFPMKEAYEGQHRQRQVEIAVQLFEAMGIARDDKEKRTDWVMRGFRQFDAPVSLVLTYEKKIGARCHQPIRPGRFFACHCAGGLGARLRLRDQWPRHHAVQRGAGACRYSGRSEHHDLHCHGLPGRDLCSQPSEVGARGQ